MLHFDPLKIFNKDVVMKKLVAISWGILNFLTLDASATLLGPYLGLGGGYGLLRTPNTHLFVNTVSTFDVNNSHSRGGIAGRAFVGYTLNRYVGVEGGYATYSHSRYSANALGGLLHSSLKFQANIADVVVKGYLPIDRIKLNLYALAGAARVFEQITYRPHGIPTNISPPSVGSTSANKTRPIYGAGIGYIINCNFFINAEYTQIQRNAGSNTVTPFINLSTINLSYHLG